jgi:hypothetical protein
VLLIHVTLLIVLRSHKLLDRYALSVFLMCFDHLL